MATPVSSESAADDTKLYAGPHPTPHAVPNDRAGHEGPKVDLEPMATRVVIALAGIFVLLLLALFALGWWPRSASERAADQEVRRNTERKPVVGITEAKPPKALPTLEVPGDAQPFQVTSIYPRASGYLKRRLVDIGDKVAEGQLLAEIDAPEVDAQLASAQATLQQGRAAATKAKDDFALAEGTFQRYQSFAKTGGVTQQQLDERESALTSARAALAGADANVRVGEAEVQRLTSLQGFTKVTAPFAGTITTRGYDVGALLSANNAGGQPLFQIAQVDMLRVFVDIPQTYASAVQIGQPVKFIVRNYPTHPFDGRVARTSGAINPQSRTMRIQADLPNAEGLLFPGMYGTLRYDVRQKTEQLVIPSSALVFGPEGMRVGVVDGQNKVRFKTVTLGVDLGTEVEIVSGLSGGDRIVANPSERIGDGTEVEVAVQKSDKPGPTQTAQQGTDRQSGPGVAEAAAR